MPRRTAPQCVSVPVTDDDVLEDVLQTFHVELTVVTSDDRVSLGQRNTATVTIRDNDSKNKHTASVYPLVCLSVCPSMNMSIYL